ncbi:hypothetical protein BBK36DRAFT_1120850 [Trichoderma citrinoviride]|uniref:F-box domain-containing protein n=1 Tax=Trichoderma citrinoviride TaxID=58853 RepID=A0A2T4B9K1_9HYPO|nr:hypothetical protein BBK36DRAFT_1120850 [Trichoderma citrinoviride]PTB65891.1 hypothetical protein BBK36DRAFT_1120850 [Trichoderma citrinoviride]
MHRLRFLRRLLGKGRRHHRDHDQKHPSAAILQLPLDILLLITDNLALHDTFLLSHTCKALRQVTFQDWDADISRLPFEDQIAFWAGLAYTLPNRWACLQCCKLHPINISDVPAAFRTVRNRAFPCSIDYSRGIEIEGYSVQHYHVQFALKLSRLGNVHQQYLAALMDSYTRTGPSLIPPLAESYAAEPRIINERFILREEWKISNNTSTALPLLWDNTDLHIPVCPHMRMSGGPARSRSWKESSIHWMVRVSNSMQQREGSVLLKEITLLEDGIALAYESPGQWIFNSCLHCPTDFAIMISTDEQEATIRAWHDFGVEGSPLDISWKEHVKDEATHYFDVGPYLDYPHGGVRESWLEGISHETGTNQAKLPSFFTKLIDTLSQVQY